MTSKPRDKRDPSVTENSTNEDALVRAQVVNDVPESGNRNGPNMAFGIDGIVIAYQTRPIEWTQIVNMEFIPHLNKQRHALQKEGELRRAGEDNPRIGWEE